MKDQEFRQMLRKLSECVRSELAEPLSAFLRYWDDFPNESIPQSLAKLNKARAKLDIEDRAPFRLIELFQFLGSVLEICGNKRSQSYVARIIDELPNKHDVQIDDFLDDLMRLRNASRNKAKSSRGAVADSQLARELSEKLSLALNDRAAFADLLAQLKDTKQVNTPTLHEVASLLLGSGKSYKGRKTALVEIERRHTDEIRFESQHKRMESLRN